MSDSENTIKLHDGRILGYFEFGAPSGKPVFYFHGGGVGSGIYAKSISLEAEKHNIRLISPDRPGIGISDPKSGRSISDWSEDVVQLADALELPSFSILSQSAGSAYAFACMRMYPDRVIKASVVSGLYPMHDKSLRKGLPPASRFLAGMLVKSPDWVIKKMFAGTKAQVDKDLKAICIKLKKRALPVEKEILADPSFMQIYLESIKHAYKQGIDAVAADFRLCFADWGFGLSEIKNMVHIWHGERDTSSPVLLAKRNEQLLTDCSSVYFPDDTHMSVLHRHIDEILTSFNM
jgi:pimeloyl-ACP methyl ester carboxylesterase